MKRFTKVSQLTLAFLLVSLTAASAEARCGRLFGGRIRKAFAKVVHPRGNCSTLSNSSACEGCSPSSKSPVAAPTCADGQCHAK